MNGAFENDMKDHEAAALFPVFSRFTRKHLKIKQFIITNFDTFY